MIKIQQGSSGPVQFKHRMQGLTTLVNGHRHAFGNLTDYSSLRMEDTAITSEELQPLQIITVITIPDEQALILELA